MNGYEDRYQYYLSRGMPAEDAERLAREETGEAHAGAPSPWVKAVTPVLRTITLPYSLLVASAVKGGATLGLWRDPASGKSLLAYAWEDMPSPAGLILEHEEFGAARIPLAIAAFMADVALNPEAALLKPLGPALGLGRLAGKLTKVPRIARAMEWAAQETPTAGALTRARKFVWRTLAKHAGEVPEDLPALQAYKKSQPVVEATRGLGSKMRGLVGTTEDHVRQAVADLDSLANTVAEAPSWRELVRARWEARREIDQALYTAFKLADHETIDQYQIWANKELPKLGFEVRRHVPFAKEPTHPERVAYLKWQSPVTLAEINNYHFSMARADLGASAPPVEITQEAWAEALSQVRPQLDKAIEAVKAAWVRAGHRAGTLNTVFARWREQPLYLTLHEIEDMKQTLRVHLERGGLRGRFMGVPKYAVPEYKPPSPEQIEAMIAAIDTAPLRSAVRQVLEAAGAVTQSGIEAEQALVKADSAITNAIRHWADRRLSGERTLPEGLEVTVPGFDQLKPSATERAMIERVLNRLDDMTPDQKYRALMELVNSAQMADKGKLIQAIFKTAVEERRRASASLAHEFLRTRFPNAPEEAHAQLDRLLRRLWRVEDNLRTALYWRGLKDLPSAAFFHITSPIEIYKNIPAQIDNISAAIDLARTDEGVAAAYSRIMQTVSQMSLEAGGDLPQELVDAVVQAEAANLKYNPILVSAARQTRSISDLEQERDILEGLLRTIRMRSTATGEPEFRAMLESLKSRRGLQTFKELVPPGLAYSYASNIREAARMVEHAKFFDRVEHILYMNDLVSDVPRPGFTRFVMPYLASTGRLQGKYVPAPVADALAVQLATNKPPDMTVLNKIVQVFKRSKTVYSPATLVNNAVSNWLYMAWVGGGLPASRLDIWWRAYRSMKYRERFYREAVNEGLITPTFITEELGEHTRLMERLRAPSWPFELAAKLHEKVGGSFARLYGKAEEFTKFAVFIWRRTKGDDVRTAADIAQRAVFDYADLSPVVARINRVVPFASFGAKLAEQIAEQAWKNPDRFVSSAKAVMGLVRIGWGWVPEPERQKFEAALDAMTAQERTMAIPTGRAGKSVKFVNLAGFYPVAGTFLQMRPFATWGASADIRGIPIPGLGQSPYTPFGWDILVAGATGRDPQGGRVWSPYIFTWGLRTGQYAQAFRELGKYGAYAVLNTFMPSGLASPAQLNKAVASFKAAATGRAVTARGDVLSRWDMAFRAIGKAPRTVTPASEYKRNVVAELEEAYNEARLDLARYENIFRQRIENAYIHDPGNADLWLQGGELWNGYLVRARQAADLLLQLNAARANAQLIDAGMRPLDILDKWARGAPPPYVQAALDAKFEMLHSIGPTAVGLAGGENEQG